MSLIGLLVLVLILGLLYWLIQLLPIPEPFKKIALVILILICVLWLLSALGLIGGLTTPIRLR